MSVTQDIQELLAAGANVNQLLEKGFKRSTIYLAKKLSKQSKPKRGKSAQLRAQTVDITGEESPTAGSPNPSDIMVRFTAETILLPAEVTVIYNWVREQNPDYNQDLAGFLRQVFATWMYDHADELSLNRMWGSSRTVRAPM